MDLLLQLDVVTPTAARKTSFTAFFSRTSSISTNLSSLKNYKEIWQQY